MSKQRPTEKELADLINLPTFKRTHDAPPSTDPIAPTPMVVAVNEIDSYDHNPRRLPNEKYDEIKASIRASGMDQTLTITRRPGASHYMISAGGNTRLQIVKELWSETGDERFRTVHCLFRPWAGDTRTLVSHLKENDVRGDLVFIDRARALMHLKTLVEEEQGEALSQRKFSTLLSDQGYSVSRTVLHSAAYATQSLENNIPVALGAGLSRILVDQIRKLHHAFVAAWNSLEIPNSDAGESLFLELLGRHDDELINLELLQRDAVTELSVSADCDVQYAAMLYGAVLDGHDVHALVEQVNGTPDSDEEPDSPDTASECNTTTPSPSEAQSATPTVRDISTTEPTRPPSTTKHPSTSPMPPTSAHTPTLGIQQKPKPIDVDALRSEACQLAHTAACLLGCDKMIIPINNGLGFLVDAVPDAVRESLPQERRPVLLCAWWMLTTISEQFATHGGSAKAVPPQWIGKPIGDGIAESRHFDRWQLRMFKEDRVDALMAVPHMPVCNYAALGLHQVALEFFDTWLSLVSTTRRIYEITHGKPWG